jgi:hypothetical protein
MKTGHVIRLATGTREEAEAIQGLLSLKPNVLSVSIKEI